MKLLPSSTIKNNLFRIPINNLILWISILLGLILITILIYDSIIFYNTVVQKEENPKIDQPPNIIIPAEIEEVVKLLDERKTQFNKLLPLKETLPDNPPTDTEE